MKTHAQAVVIGGGLAGCSILYHLAKLGWRDSVLLERAELTSGSTWRVAANIHGRHDFEGSNNLGQPIFSQTERARHHNFAFVGLRQQGLGREINFPKCVAH